MALLVLAAVMIIAALVLFLIETVTPHGVMGILGGLLVIGAVYIIIQEQGWMTGILSLIIISMLSVVVVILGFKYMPNSALGRLLILNDSETREEGYSAGADELYQDLIGAEGTADSYLRPAGIGAFDNRRVDVVSEGEFIPRGTRIKVTAVNGNRVVVRPL